jgi:hypothetical protein
MNRLNKVRSHEAKIAETDFCPHDKSHEIKLHAICRWDKNQSQRQDYYICHIMKFVPTTNPCDQSLQLIASCDQTFKSDLHYRSFCDHSRNFA